MVGRSGGMCQKFESQDAFSLQLVKSFSRWEPHVVHAFRIGHSKTSSLTTSQQQDGNFPKTNESQTCILHQHNQHQRYTLLFSQSQCHFNFSIIINNKHKSNNYSSHKSKQSIIIIVFGRRKKMWRKFTKALITHYSISSRLCSPHYKKIFSDQEIQSNPSSSSWMMDWILMMMFVVPDWYCCCLTATSAWKWLKQRHISKKAVSYADKHVHLIRRSFFVRRIKTAF